MIRKKEKRIADNSDDGSYGKFYTSEHWRRAIETDPLLTRRLTRLAPF